MILGNKCALCGATAPLTFDCIVPMGHKHHVMSTVARVKFYEEQMRKGNLQLLCFTCNVNKGCLPMPRYVVNSDFERGFHCR